MGVRYYLITECAYCREEQEVYYAPTCGFDTYDCVECGKTNFIARPVEGSSIKLNRVTTKDIELGYRMASSVYRTDNELERISENRLNELRRIKYSQ